MKPVGIPGHRHLWYNINNDPYKYIGQDGITSMTSLLTQEQWDILDGMRSNLGLAADLAQAKISLILPLDRSR